MVYGGGSDDRKGGSTSRYHTLSEDAWVKSE